MKRKLLYILSALVISFTSTGFGFLESSTAVHRRANHTIKNDSLSINSVNISLKNASIPQKQVQKSGHQSITETAIQWMVNVVRNTVEKIMAYVVNVLQSILISLIEFFTK
jgi:hypothetical protein